MVTVKIIEAYEENGIVREYDEGEIGIGEFEFLPRIGEELIPPDKHTCKVLQVRHFSATNGHPSKTELLVKRI